jgi:hypothetical protein
MTQVRATRPLSPRARSRVTLFATLLLLLTGGAMAAARTAAASSFPTTESLDTFQRAAENPLSDGGKWSKLAWTKTIGRVFSTTYGWVPKEGGAEASEAEADGAYWNAREFSNPAASVHIYAENLKAYVALWCDSTGTSSKNGYRLRIVGLGKTTYAFKLVLEKWVNGTKTVLGESGEVLFKGASSENVVGISAINGTVTAWYGTTESALAAKAEAADSTFSHGYVGIEGTDDSAYGETQYRAAGFPPTESLDSFERAAENPLSNGGKWSKLAWAKTIGRVYSATFGWVPKEGGLEAPESEADGTYWNVREFAGPAVAVHMDAENRHDYVALWCDTTGAGSKNGYRLKVLGTDTANNYAFKLILEKWVSGTRTQLAESSEILFKGSSSENVVGITASGGKVAAWYGTTEATLAIKAEASDTTFSHGYVGLEGTDDSAFGETKYRAAGNEKEEHESKTKPVNTVRPTIAGPHTYGKEETANRGTWTGTEPISYAYQWERCEAECKAISGATASTYVVAEADIGKTLRVKVTATNSAGSSSEVSASSEVVTGPPFNTALPEITGQATERHYEYASHGTWIGTGTISYAYQWYLCEPGCIPIEGATGSVKNLESPTEVGKTLMVKVTATNSYGSGVVFSNPTPTVTANACGFSTDEGATHCYGVAVWPYENLGITRQIRTFFASVPVPTEDFVTNEMWDIFARGGWIEAGDIAGRNAGFDYFTASDIPEGYETHGFYFTDLTAIAPEADSWFETTIHAAGSGVWYIYMVGKHEWSWGSQPGSASRGEDGMEATNDNIYASGQSMNLSYWSASNGQLYEGWSGDYGTPQGSGCITVTGDTSESFSNECDPPAFAERPEIRAGADTHAAVRPEALALGAAQSDGDPSPTAQQSVKTTVLDGAMTLSPPGSEAPTDSAAARASLSKKAELVVLHGHFTLGSAPVPRGASTPTGSVLSLVIDEATGAIVFTALTNHAPSLHSLEALGQVSDIVDPANSAAAQQ